MEPQVHTEYHRLLFFFFFFFFFLCFSFPVAFVANPPFSFRLHCFPARYPHRLLLRPSWLMRLNHHSTHPQPPVVSLTACPELLLRTKACQRRREWAQIREAGLTSPIKPSKESSPRRTGFLECPSLRVARPKPRSPTMCV